MKTPDTPESAASLLTEAEELVETRLSYASLKMVDKTAGLSGSVIVIAVVFFLIAGLILILSVAFAFYISAKTGSRAGGFFALGIFYLIVMLIMILFRQKLIKTRLTTALIKKMAS